MNNAQMHSQINTRHILNFLNLLRDILVIIAIEFESYILNKLISAMCTGLDKFDESVNTKKLRKLKDIE